MWHKFCVNKNWHTICYNKFLAYYLIFKKFGIQFAEIKSLAYHLLLIGKNFPLIYKYKNNILTQSVSSTPVVDILGLAFFVSCSSIR